MTDLEVDLMGHFRAILQAVLGEVAPFVETGMTAEEVGRLHRNLSNGVRFVADLSRQARDQNP